MDCFLLTVFVLYSFGLFLLWKVYLCLVVPREVDVSPLSVVLGGRFFFERKGLTDSGFVEFIGVLYWGVLIRYICRNQVFFYLFYERDFG
jgi:hypothetical protein